PANAEVTAFIAGAMSAALSIGGSWNLTVRSRHGAKMRSRQSRIAVGSPASASSTALRVKASDSPSSSAAATLVALLREPIRRPAGFPDRPFSNVRAPAPTVLVKAHQPFASPRSRRQISKPRSLGSMQCYFGNFMIIAAATKPSLGDPHLAMPASRQSGASSEQLLQPVGYLLGCALMGEARGEAPLWIHHIDDRAVIHRVVAARF